MLQIVWKFQSHAWTPAFEIISEQQHHSQVCSDLKFVDSLFNGKKFLRDAYSYHN